MIRIKEYVVAESLEQAYLLNQKKNNRIIAGMLWLKMSRLNINTAIDLSDLGLDKIEETQEEFRIGCMTSLRDIEQHVGLNEYTQDAISDCLKDIVGVQFRNLATIGASIYSRFGFSDALCLLLCLDTYVELYKGGIVPLCEYNEMKKDRDILIRIIIKKQKNFKCAFTCLRNSKTDFSVINVALSRSLGTVSVCVGARPMRAKRLSFDLSQIQSKQELAEMVCNSLSFGSNMRATGRYRKHLAGILISRLWEEIIR